MSITSPAPDAPRISFRDVSLSRPTGFLGRQTPILKHVTFDVLPGMCVGFVGNNGAGKSTTIKVLLGLLRPTSGSALLSGIDSALPAARRRVGYVPERPAVPELLTPREVLRLHADIVGVDVDTSMLLSRVGLEDVATRRTGGFSKGMQQRLSVACALVGAPDVLILDEPMSGLDPDGRQMVETVIRDEHRRGTSILFSSHVLGDVGRLATHVLSMAAGEVTSFVSIGERERAAHHFDVVVSLDGELPSALAALAPTRDGQRLLFAVGDEQLRHLLQVVADADELRLISVAPRLVSDS